MNRNQAPKRGELFIPVLDVIQGGEKLYVNEISERVIKKHYPNLPPEVLGVRLKSGQLKIVNTVGWAVSALGIAKLIATPERGKKQITDKGLAVLATGKYTPQDLHSDKDFIAYYNRKAGSDKETRKNTLEVDNTQLGDDTPSETIEQAVLQIEEQVKASLLDILRQIHWYDFEEVILVLLERMGYGSFETTPKSNDGGIDGIVNQDELGFEKMYIQAKRYKDSSIVRAGEMRHFIGSLSGYSTRKGIFVTTSEFDRKSQEVAENAKGCEIILIDGNQLVDLMYKHDCGVRLSQSYEVKEVDAGFFDGQTSE